jgi:hypothetical protein
MYIDEPKVERTNLMALFQKGQINILRSSNLAGMQAYTYLSRRLMKVFSLWVPPLMGVNTASTPFEK